MNSKLFDKRLFINRYFLLIKPYLREKNMSKFTMDELTNAMADTEKIRNVSIVAQVDAGKSTLTDSLLCHAGLISKKEAGDKRQTDTMQQEKDRGITIKSVGVSLYVPHPSGAHIFNVVDSPGHVDFNSEVSAALRVTDGSIVLIDTIDGVKAQTKTVLVQSLQERVKPILMINKIDKLFLSLHMNHEEIYDQFLKNVFDVNAVVEMYQDGDMVEQTSDLKVDPEVGNVAFGSAYHSWGFTLKTFARIYAPKMPKKTIPELMKFLWKRENFVKLIIKPIQIVLNCCESHPEKSTDGFTLQEASEKLSITLQKSDYELRGKELFRAVMGSWLPVAEAVIEASIDHLPSPKAAQKYRADLLYSGPKDDMYYEAIKNCDANGPLIIFISKMIPTKDNSHFYAFGRVFSGTVTSTKVKILLNDHDPTKNNNKTALDDSIKRVIIMMANRMENVQSIPVGNTLAIDGIDKTMVKTGTVVGEEHFNCYPIKNIVFKVSPVVRYSIRPKNPSDIAKFADTLKKFVKSDPCLQYIYNKEANEHILAGAGELHLDVAIEQLKTDFLKGVEMVQSDPIVQYCETVIAESSQVCLAKSANKHNRLFATAEPMTPELVSYMEGPEMSGDFKDRAQYLYKNCEGVNDPKKVWAVAPEIAPVNIFTNDTIGVQYLNEVQGSITSGFLSTCCKGPLCDEPVRGVRFNLKDAKLHADNVHRADNQIPTRAVIYASILTAQPRLMEPIFSVDIAVPREHVSKIYSVMTKRRGMVKTIVPESNNVIMTVDACLPVANSFGFIDELREATSGTAFASMSFSHWQIIPDDPLVSGTYSNKIMLEIRKRKGRKVEAPKLEDYLDKL